MKQPRKFLQETSQKLDLPADIAAGLPKLELTGFSQLSIEHHKGILEYTDKVIAVALNIGTVRVTGSKLTIRLMNREFLVLSGELAQIELLAEGAHE